MSKRKKEGKKPRVSKMWKGVKVVKASVSEKQMTRDHADVLQNIEFVLVQAYRRDRSIDDSTVRDALRAALAGVQPSEERRKRLFDELADVRDSRAGIPDELWHGGLRTVLKSVRRHSTLKPGDIGYLAFVSAFFP